MLKLFRAFSATPYVYDSNTNDFYRIDENVYQALTESGETIAGIRDETIRANFAAAGITDEELPLQSPEDFKKECESMNMGLRKLIIGLTHTCNLRCRYCIYSGNYADERTHEAKSMSPETADRIIDTFFVRRNGDHPKTVVFYGGEPFMNFPIIRRIVDTIDSLGKQVAFSATTNGVMLKQPPVLEFLVKHNFIINISFDGPVQEQMRVDEKGRGTFQDLMALFEHMNTTYPDFYRDNVGFNVTITAATNLPETVEFFNTHPLFKGKTLNIIRHYDPDNTFCRKYDLMEHEKTLKDGFEELRTRFPDVYRENLPFHNGCYTATMGRLNQRPMGKTPHLPLNSCCYPGLNAIFVDIDGTCSACERTEHAPIGHLDSEPVKNDVADDYVARYHAIASRHCPRCWAARLCAKCFSHVKRGTVNEENFLSNCDDFRDSLRRSLELFVTIKEKDEHAFDDIKVITEIPVPARK